MRKAVFQEHSHRAENYVSLGNNAGRRALFYFIFYFSFQKTPAITYLWVPPVLPLSSLWIDSVFELSLRGTCLNFLEMEFIVDRWF
jgi:hypothetical protein